MIKFITFYPSLCNGTATTQLNQWIEEHPEIEVISWQTTPGGAHNELYITIQYKEN